MAEYYFAFCYIFYGTRITENPVFDENQRSILSVDDLAVAIADEAENAKHHQQRFTAAY